METALEQRIRERAYEIWNAEGQAAGKAADHWLAAEREVLASLARCSSEPAAGPPRKARASTRRRATKQPLG